MCVLDLPRFWSKRHTFSALKITVILVDKYLGISGRFWVHTIALIVLVHVLLLLRNICFILRAGLKCAILETGRNSTFGALLESLGATNISGFVATALIWPPFSGGRHMTLPEAVKTGIPDFGWLRAIFMRKALN